MSIDLASSTLIDAVIVFTMVEVVALWAYRRATGRGVALGSMALNLSAGFCLMLAARCVAVGGSTAWVLLCLAAAGLAHGADVVRRWQR